MSDWELDEEIEELWGMINHSTPNIMNAPDSSGLMEISSDNSTWRTSTEEYIKNLIEKAREEQQQHKKNKSFYQQAKHFTAIPSILSGIVMGAVNQETDDYTQKAVFLSNSVIIAMSYYFDFAGKYLLSKKSYDQYTKLINEMEETLALPKEKRPLCSTTLDKFSTEYMRILSSS